MQGYYLRIYFEDGSYFSVPVNLQTTAKEVIELLLKKKSRVISGSASDYSLYVAQAANADELFERRLESSENPLALQEKVRVQGHLHQFRFHLRNDSKTKVDENELSSPEQTPRSKSLRLSGGRAKSTSSSPSRRMWKIAGGGGGVTEGRKRWWGVSPRASGSVTGSTKWGYLEKKGPREKEFRMRWFVLQQGKLFYFKNHLSSPLKPISSIDLRHAIVTGVEGSSLFSLKTPDKAYMLKAETPGDVSEWARHVRKHSDVYAENNEFAKLDRSIEATEQAVATSDIESSRSLLSLKNALKNPVTLNVIYEYMKKKHCDENLEFVLAVNEFEKRFASFSTSDHTGSSTSNNDDTSNTNHVTNSTSRRTNISDNDVKFQAASPVTSTSITPSLTPFGASAAHLNNNHLEDSTSSSPHANFNTAGQFSNSISNSFSLSSSIAAHASTTRSSKEGTISPELSRNTPKNSSPVSLRGDDEAQAEAIRIYNRFINQSSPRCVCISRRESKQILDAVMSGKLLKRSKDSPRSSHKSAFNGQIDPSALHAPSAPSEASSSVHTCYSKFKRQTLSNIETQQFQSLVRSSRYRQLLMSMPYVLPGSLDRNHPLIGNDVKNRGNLKGDDGRNRAAGSVRCRSTARVYHDYPRAPTIPPPPPKERSPKKRR